VFSVLEKTKALREGGWKKMSVPSFIFQASDDVYVINRGHKTVCSQAKNCKIKQFANSYHELYLEVDSIRNALLKETLMFFEQY
jgi:alpha-beta hydrolase superfamily lysophospholipase